MRTKLFLAAVVLLPVTALAQPQQPTPPSQQALITVLHTQLGQETDLVTVDEARIADLQAKIAALQAKTCVTTPKHKGH